MRGSRVCTVFSIDVVCKIRYTDPFVEVKYVFVSFVVTYPDTVRQGGLFTQLLFETSRHGGTYGSTFT